MVKKDTVPNSRPTVMISATSGWAIRNYFHTGLVAEISTFADVVVATTQHLRPFFKDLCAAGIIVSVVELPSQEPRLPAIVRQAKKAVLQARQNVYTAKIQWLRRGRNRLSRILRSFVWIAGRLLAANWQLALLESVERHLPTHRHLRLPGIPTLLVNTSPFAFSDNGLQRELQRQGVPVIVIIPSWDNPSSKGCILSRSDLVLVWGDHQKRELERYYRSIAAERIVVSGVPQFDIHSVDLPQEFCRSQYLEDLSISQNARLLLYATGTPLTQPEEPYIVRALADAIDQGRLGPDVHLLVRCHPADDVSRYSDLESAGRVTIFPRPTVRHSSRLPGVHPLSTWLPPVAETLVLSATLRHSEVCINTASTVTLDALACNKPVINIGFDGDSKRPYLHSVRRYYDQEHYRPIVESGAVPVVESMDELLLAIDKLLVSPADLKNRRRVLLESLCHRPEGGSVNLIARQIQRIASSCGKPASWPGSPV